MFFLCVIGGAVVGILSLIYFLLEAWGRASYLYDGPLLGLALAIAIVFGVIVGVAVGIVVMISSTISRRVNGSRVPGIIAGVIGSCTSMWLLAGSSPELLVYFGVVAVAASVALSLAARAIDRSELAFGEASVRSVHDVDSSATP